MEKISDLDRFKEVDREVDSPGYYAVIPATVRYHNKLLPNAKLLYGEITALCNKQGFCWASNKYFAKLYGVDVSSVKRWVRSLRDFGFIFCESTRKDSRKIFICEKKGKK